MQGQLIVIEGLDGSGKATQTKLLCEALIHNGHKAMQVSFPNYDSLSSSLVKMYLNGDFGTRPGDTNAYAASCLYTVDRYASFKTIWQDFYKEGGIVVADRYTTSNAIHQCAKLDPAQWDAYLEWLFDLEYEKVAIPAPSLVIYLDVDIDISQQLMTMRYNGKEDKKDIHERDREYLGCSNRAAHYCADKLGWHTIECVKDGAIRSIEAIHSSIMSCIKDKNII